MWLRPRGECFHDPGGDRRPWGTLACRAHWQTCRAHWHAGHTGRRGGIYDRRSMCVGANVIKLDHAFQTCISIQTESCGHSFANYWNDKQLLGSTSSVTSAYCGIIMPQNWSHFNCMTLFYVLFNRYNRHQCQRHHPMHGKQRASVRNICSPGPPILPDSTDGASRSKGWILETARICRLGSPPGEARSISKWALNWKVYHVIIDQWHVKYRDTW